LSPVASLIQVPHRVLPSFLTGHQEDHLDHSVKWAIWEGQAGDKAEALESAEKADAEVESERMRIRYERDLNKR
jgi:hypothetical protein